MNSWRENEKLILRFSEVLMSSTKPQIFVNSRRCQGENGIGMHANVKRTCRACKAFVFAH